MSTSLFLRAWHVGRVGNTTADEKIPVEAWNLRHETLEENI
jgi:hypothetical protein